MKRVITVDIGNSTITMGIFEGYELKGRKGLRTEIDRSKEEYRNEIKDFIQDPTGEVNGSIISSVVPELTEIISSALLNVTGIAPLIIGVNADSGISFDVLNPVEVGPDRIANVVGAKRLYGDPAIVVDFGTATTLSLIRDNAFIGGAIIPGLDMMARALNSYTSRLPLVSLTEISGTEGDIQALGKDTRKNIISGIIYGTAGAVERLIQEIEVRQDRRFRIVLTGGFSVIMTRFLRRDFLIDPDLTLKGLRFIYEDNSYA